MCFHVAIIEPRFHSVLEGLAQGAATTLETGTVLLIGILVHKSLAAFALGCLFIESEMPRRTQLLLRVLRDRGVRSVLSELATAIIGAFPLFKGLTNMKT